MKLQNLAIMFIIIVLPISMILSSYTASRVQTLSLQISYDSKLDNATYDAIKAFQLNTANSSTSDLANSKIRDIKASVNTFFNSVSSNFNLSGYNKESIQNYVPALVYTLYDGYYIYTPYQNTWDQETIDKTDNYESYGSEASYHGGTTDDSNREILFGLKPYVYYSCRYKKDNIDVVITYSLDTYITIKGKIGDNVVNEKGYLLTSASVSNDSLATYRGVQITTENGLSENTIVDGTIKQGLQYRKINGVKYYKDNTTGEIFQLLNGHKGTANGITSDYITQNNNAVLYYKNASTLKEKLNSDPVLSKLKNLSTANAVDENGQSLSSEFGNHLIFDELFNSSSETQIEDSDSIFNSHRLDVIKYSIERNLAIVIENFNHYSGSTNKFSMPKLQDHEWDAILNNVSMISFLQGLSIGGKIYNGYSIVTNNKNEEFVGEDTIYILTSDQNYHRVKDSDLSTLNLSGARGYFNMDFERKAGESSTGLMVYYYPVEGVTGCYNSIVNQRGIQNSSINDILTANPTLAKIYYTALGRERYGMYRVESIDT